MRLLPLLRLPLLLPRPPSVSPSRLFSTPPAAFSAASLSADPCAAAHLLTYACGYPPSSFAAFLSPPAPLPAAGDPPREGWEEEFGRLLERHGGGEPVQYLVGSWDFHCLAEIICRAPVLIPRPETEQLVERVISSLSSSPSSSPKPKRLLDIGTGTGCIPLAVGASLPNVEATGADLSPAAVALAGENAAKFRGQMLPGSSFEAVLCAAAELRASGLAGFGVVTANPPYIPTATYHTLEPTVREHEDRLALDGGGDGMDVTRQVLEFCASGNGVECELHMELDEGQPGKVLEACKRYKGFVGGRAWSDYAGRERFVEIEWSGEKGEV
ncbi:hypothetical protein TeGR_g6964 [Tetraparma gracilis]|uniref:peptide chain release factor N(5)-glutamine methyltransferase n=1 Tax=Tetraparma gracilis TaxID=2962635 RepID=A0ABQ6N2B1_9STRA|nr:hypothetical protein TeGR_g6964 [Tetraparma gracilis]